MIDDENRRYLLRKKQEIIGNCPICHGTKPYCKCTYDFRVEIHKATSNIPIAYREFKLEDLTHPQLTEQKKKVAAFLETVCTPEQKDLLITGGPGLAKSAVACLILMKVLEKGKKAFYFPSVRSAMDACLEDFRGDAHSTSYEQFKTSDTIVIDGLGYGFIRERTNGTDIVLDHLERRKLLGKHIVFVSSVPVEELAGGEKTLIDLLQPTVINFKGFNYVQEVLEKTDEKKAKEVKKLSVRSIKRRGPAVRQDGTPMSPYEIALQNEHNKVQNKKAKNQKRKRK